MDRLKRMKESLMNAVEGQISGHLTEVDSKELGEAVDMIKDLAEAIYYCTITEAMEGDKQKDKYEKERYSMYYPPMRYHYPVEEYYDPRYRDVSYRGGANGGSGMSGSSSSSGNSGNSSGTSYNAMMPMYNDGTSYMTRDLREGKSPMRRKMYMEGKMTHRDKTKSMTELEAYMNDLASDMAEMVQDATPEEKQLLQQKISTLASKIR